MTLEQIFGVGENLDAFQMAARAVVLFCLMLVLVHVAGMRTFGRKAAFDTILMITIGALLSRVVVGASAAIPTVVASVVLVALHRIIAIVTALVPSLERVVKGGSTWLYRGGMLNQKAMKRAGISRADLEEAVRAKSNRHSLAEVLEIHLESSGDLSVVEDVVGEARRLQKATAP